MPIRCSQHITQGESPYPKPRTNTAAPTGTTVMASTASARRALTSPRLMAVSSVVHAGQDRGPGGDGEEDDHQQDADDQDGKGERLALRLAEDDPRGHEDQDEIEKF